MIRLLFLLSLSLLAASAFTSTSAAEPISFKRDVMAVFSKAGCNNGGCHGNAKGRGVLKLSLRGEFPTEDFPAVTQSKSLRLVMRHDPAQSALLRKPTLQLGHEGGKRFEVDSLEYQTLLTWIEQGAPDDSASTPELVELQVTPEERVVVEPETSVDLKVTARFADGTERDVSRWAVYEPSELIVKVSEAGRVTATRSGETTISVRYLNLQRPVPLAFVPARPDFQWADPVAVNGIDTEVFAKLRRLRMNPSARADDSVLVRRATLDLTGCLPSAEEARAFVASDHPNKRERLIDALLSRPAYADFWALKWSDLLRNEEKALDETGLKHFQVWIRDAFATGKPLDQFARELVTGIGSSYENPPANYYRALRDPTLRAEATAQLFLGTRLQCARCHRHPYERWSQDDYYQFSAVFDGMDYEILENKRGDKLDKNEFVGEQRIQVGLKKTLKDPRSGKEPPAAFLPIPGMREQPANDLAALGDWLTARENPLFARVQANRVWFQVFGKGVVDPVDDFRSTNPAINPGLLALLERELVGGDFDLRRLLHYIMTSATYQLDATPNATNGDDERNFSHALVRRQPAEVLLDAMHQVLGTTPRFTGDDRALTAVQFPGIESIHRNRRPTNDDHFLKLFGRPVRQMNSDLERSNETSLAQVFEMTSGRGINELLGDPANHLGKLVFLDDAELVDRLYWTALSRPPKQEERARLIDYLNQAPERRVAVEDIAWALINSKAFLLRE